MFEKEAEKWVENNLHSTEEDYIKAFKDGAEFGYNKAKVEVEDSYRESLCNSELNLASVTEQLEELEKANEWHYVKDELPPEDVPLLCIRGGKIYVAWYWDNIYHDSRCCQVKKPYAWKEIILP